MDQCKKCKDVLYDSGEMLCTKVQPIAMVKDMTMADCPRRAEFSPATTLTENKKQKTTAAKRAVERQKNDLIRHPNHYTWRGVEAIDIVKALTRGAGGLEAYLLGCSIKYMYRYPMKNGAQDLDKAIQCLKMLREFLYGKPPEE